MGAQNMIPARASPCGVGSLWTLDSTIIADFSDITKEADAPVCLVVELFSRIHYESLNLCS